MQNYVNLSKHKREQCFFSIIGTVVYIIKEIDSLNCSKFSINGENGQKIRFIKQKRGLEVKFSLILYSVWWIHFLPINLPT